MLLAGFTAAGAAEHRIAFERNDAVWTANLDGTGEKKIATGIFPALSPDGTRIALTTVDKSGTTFVRHIAVVDLATNKTNVFKNVPSDNVYYPSWSPDGTRILFTLRVNELWDLGLINPDGTEFRTLKKGEQDKVTLYSPCWARDGKSIFCQDVTDVYHLDVNGTVLDQWKIEKIIPNGDMSGDGRIDVSPNGKFLLLSIDMGEEHNRKDWDGPPPALWTFEIATQKAFRLGRLLDRQRQYFVFESTRGREIGLALSHVDPRQKSQAPDCRCAHAKCERAVNAGTYPSARTTPPSALTAAPFIAEASGLQTNATTLAISSG